MLGKKDGKLLGTGLLQRTKLKMSLKKNLGNSWNFPLHISQCLLNTKVYVQLPVGEVPQLMVSGMIFLYHAVTLSF